MPSLLSTLNLATRSLQAQQEGVAVAGQNLANVNNPAYARQRVTLQTSAPISTGMGSLGTGVDAVSVVQVRNGILDTQIQTETGLTSSLQAQQSALQYAEASLGEQLNGATGTSDSTSGATGGLSDALSGLFNAFENLSASPASLAARQQVISQAQQVASQFNQVSQRLSTLNDQLNQSVQTDVGSANQLLSDIAGLNKQIAFAEANAPGSANDLRDLRQSKLEQLSALVSVQTATTSDGAVNISVGGTLLVDGSGVEDSLQTYDAGGGQLLISDANSNQPLALSGGSIEGTITARDTALKSLSTGLNNLASQLISQVNGIYTSGYDLNGQSGAKFFTGAGAADIGVTGSLADDPSGFQASSSAGASGDNQVVLALANLANLKQASLGGLTFSASYDATVTALGSALSSVNGQLSDQQTVQTMLQNQRASVSGVSIDEEMTSMVSFQRAFEASAHLVTTLDQMLNDVITMKQ